MAYARVNWQNAPSVATPLTANNLNRMDSALEGQDQMITTNANNIKNNYTELTPFYLWTVGKKTSSSDDMHAKGWKSGVHYITSEGGQSQYSFDKFEFVDFFAVDRSGRECHTRATFPDSPNIDNATIMINGFSATDYSATEYRTYNRMMVLSVTSKDKKLEILQNIEVLTIYDKTSTWGDSSRPWSRQKESSVSYNYGASNNPYASEAPLSLIEIVGWWRDP